jgi:hypothetical protein
VEKFHNSPPVDPVISITAPEIKKRLASWVKGSISAIVIGGMATAFAADELPVSNDSSSKDSGTSDTFIPSESYEIWGYFPSQEEDSDKNINVLVMSNRGEKVAAQDLEANTKGINFASLNVYSYDPQPKDFEGYDAVLLFENGLFNNTKDVGQALYNYQQNGGGVVLSTFVWQDWSNQSKYGGRVGWGPLETISPLISDTRGCEYNTDNMGKILNPTHPIMKNVNSLYANSYRGGTQISTVGKALALWSTPNYQGNDDPVVAYNEPETGGKIVAISVFPDYKHYSSGFGGDFYQLFENAFKWLSDTSQHSGPGKFEFTSKIYFANEKSGNAIVKVARKGGSTGVATVNYATAAFEDTDTVDPTSNPAAEGEDYATTEGSLTWKDGENDIKTFKVPVFDDRDEEGDETVNLVLSSPTGATLGDQKTAKLRIADDECHGVYTTAARTLYHPLITVPVFDPISGQPTEDIQVFEGTFTLLHGTEDFKIDVTDQEQFNFVKQIKNVDKLKADCYAKYDWQTETFKIPYVDVPSIVVLPMGQSKVGPTQIFRAKMQQMPLSGEYGIGTYLFHVEGEPFQDFSITADANASVHTESKDEVEAEVDASIEVAPDELTYYQYLYTYDK